MVQQKAFLLISDNSGARRALVIRLRGGSKRRYAGPRRHRRRRDQTYPTGQVKKVDVARRHVRTAKETRRRMMYIRFDENAAVLITIRRARATLIFRSVARGFGQKRYRKSCPEAPAGAEHEAARVQEGQAGTHQPAVLMRLQSPKAIRSGDFRGGQGSRPSAPGHPKPAGSRSIGQTS